MFYPKLCYVRLAYIKFIYECNKNRTTELLHHTRIITFDRVRYHIIQELSSDYML